MVGATAAVPRSNLAEMARQREDIKSRKRIFHCPSFVRGVRSTKTKDNL
jgi:hypothetical protein